MWPGGYSAAAVPGNAAIGVLIIPVSVAVDHAGNLDVGDGPWDDPAAPAESLEHPHDRGG